MFTFLSSLYDDPDRRRSAVSALGNLHQRNKSFSDFMPEFTRLMNDVGYTDDQSKIDLLSVKLSDEMNQLLIGQDMPTDYLGYVTRLHKLDTDVRVANQRKNLRTSSRSNLTARGNTTTSNFAFPPNSNSQPPTFNPFSYQPPPLPPQITTTPSPFFPVQPATTQTLPTLIELDSSSRPRGPLISGYSLLQGSFSPLVSDQDIRGEHLVLECSISLDQKKICTQILIDTGASGYAFISDSFAQSHNLPLTPLSAPIVLETFDGRPVVSGNLTHKTTLDISIGPNSERMPLLVTRLGHYPIVLGIPWLRRHDPYIKFPANSLVFNSSFCTNHCLPNTALRYTSIEGILDIAAQPRIPTSITIPDPLPPPRPTPPLLPKPDIYMIGASAFQFLAKRPEVEIFTLSINAINHAVKKHSDSDIEIALKGKSPVDLLSKLPPKYHSYTNIFSVSESDKLPHHRSYDHAINLEPGTKPDHGSLYGMSRDELLVLKKYLEDNLRKGFIRASTSSAALPVLFVRKPGGGLRFCVDYRKLNAITIKDRYPIPLIQETLNRLSQACWFSKFDVIAAFNKMRIKEGEEWKTAFKTRYGLYEYLVMPFGLANAPSSFQHYINDTLQGYLDIFATAYIDDILVYSNSLPEHRKHVGLVLDRMREAGLQLDISKSEFHVQEVIFLGLLVGKDGIRMDPKKIEAI